MKKIVEKSKKIGEPLAGVMAQGYGRLPRAAMLDPDISIGAKALYAYLCSMRGSGDIYPSRKRLCADLHIGTATLTRFIEELVSNNYIEVNKLSLANTTYKRNFYSIVTFPVKYKSNPQSEMLTQIYNKVRNQGIDAAGYGYIPRMITIADLTIKAKAIYGYLCCYADNTTHMASPNVGVMCKHLGISETSLRSYTRELREHNLILTQQRHEHGHLSGNDYIIVQDPQISTTDTHRIVVYKSNTQIPSSECICLKTNSVETISIDTDNIPVSQTNSVINKNSFKQSIHETSTCRGQETQADRLIEVRKLSEEQIRKTIADAGELPYTLCADSGTVNAALRILTESSRPAKTEDRGERQRYELFLTALTEMLTAGREPTRIRGAKLYYAKVVDALNFRVSAGYDEYDEPYAEVFQLYEDVSCRFNRASEKVEIKNPLGYMKAMIWTELTTDMVETDNKIRFDFVAGEEYAAHWDSNHNRKRADDTHESAAYCLSTKAHQQTFTAPDDWRMRDTIYAAVHARQETLAV